ncbi:positive regulator of sigma(E), RseC/MucC [bacterium BMS3Bbin06]|nr:positive regulator of sigma(E), RseC/MucC [bacterium BMS3Abin08]GBE34461.1 positive regulator of sigma(E), RseC/MucC [bacterium BMS3Bbin06]HDO35082.1 hypothetical protein [Nitrospirota bacterium]HDY71155.1 hypothetical protein [Nitrospirota bacterium]
MNEIGVVKSIDGHMAKVIVYKKSACDHCTENDCDIKGNGFETEAINMAHANIGETVKVVMKAQTYIKGALVLYILPVFALMAGALLGKVYLPVYFSGLNSELLSVLGGFISLFLSLVAVKILSARMERKTEYKSVIEEILDKNKPQ